MKSIRIGNGCGFWGDQLDAPLRLVQGSQLDYLTLEYLAELTMSILAYLRQRDPQAGYATDFIDVLQQVGPELAKQPQLKIITNAGGMNPLACAQKAHEVLAKHGLSGTKIGVVHGDDLLPRLDELLAAGHELKNLETGEPLHRVRQRLVSANAYLGSAPIAEALGLGARIVITGRVADACLTVGPCIHEFGWSPSDWHSLCAATVVGHLIECGAQVTGGLWTQADTSTHLEDVGYPIATVQANGDFTISKPANTGGAVNLETVAEQLLYEVVDPANYYTPDVVADFTTPRFDTIEENIVRGIGSQGKPATDTYKVSIAYKDGYMSSGTLVIYGPKAVERAKHSGEMILHRLKKAGYEYEHSHMETLGVGDCVPGVLPAGNPGEVVLRVAVRDADKAKVERFTKEFAPLVTSGYPGTTGYTTGRPVVRPVFAYWPALIAKSAVKAKVQVFD